MAREFQISSKEVGVSANARSADVEQERPSRYDIGALDGTYFSHLPLATPSTEDDSYPIAQSSANFGAQHAADPFCMEAAFGHPGNSDFLNDQEWDISQNTLYGLFAPLPS